MATITRPLFDTLQTEFCPALDSSLIAALLVEIERDGQGNTIIPTEDQIAELRATLVQLSLLAEDDEAQQSEVSDFQVMSLAEEQDTISSWTTPDGNDDASACSKRHQHHSFSSPLGFLQAALPEVPIDRLRSALQAYDHGSQEHVDMWEIIATILSEEFIREREERGLDGLEDDEPKALVDDNWEVVQIKKASTTATRKKQPQPRAKRFAVADIRQQHQVVQHQHKQRGSVEPDRWTQLTSLASHLSDLLPPNPPTLFLSFFHSPNYSTPYEALRAALTSLRKSSPSPSSGDSDSDSDSTSTAARKTTVLFNLLDVVLAEFDDLDAEDRSKLISDVELAMSVSQGAEDASLDLVHVLRELDSENADLGLYHLRPSTSSTSNTSVTSSPSSSKLHPPHPPHPPPDVRTNVFPDHPPPVQPPPKDKPPPSTSSSSSKKINPYQWQTIPTKKIPSLSAHPLAAHIPTYAKDVNGMRTGKARKAGASGSGSGSVNGTYEMRRRMGVTMRKREEMLREASRMWQRGNKKTRGGEVAFYFAERAREFQEMARLEALNATRMMVMSKRNSSGSYDMIDLHGATVDEAIVIVKEILEAQGAASLQSKPLKIVTGRGAHSAGHISVLKPAVRKELMDDGWIVSAWDAGLIVKGRKA